MGLQSTNTRAYYQESAAYTRPLGHIEPTVFLPFVNPQVKVVASKIFPIDVHILQQISPTRIDQDQ